MTEDPGDQTRVLAIKQAVRDALTNYCRAMDRMDMDLALEVWHPGGTCNYIDTFEGTGAEFVEWVWVVHKTMLGHSHQITNVLVDVDVDRERAVSEAYTTNVLWTRPEDAPVEMVSRGRYLDQWSCRNGRWAIDHRVYVRDLLTTAPLPPRSLDGIASRSHRDRRDPVYELFASLPRSRT